MKLNQIIALIWLLGTVAVIGSFQAPEIKSEQSTVVTTLTAGGITTTYKNGQVSTQAAAPVVTVEKPTVEPIKTNPAQPKDNGNLTTKPEDVTDGVWEWRDLVGQYFPQDQLVNALRIMSAENGAGTPERVSKANRNGTRDYGLFQINTCHIKRVDGDLSRLQNAETNVKIASDIYQEQGWRPWSTAKKLGLD